MTRYVIIIGVDDETKDAVVKLIEGQGIIIDKVIEYRGV